jgi:tetratricopeptide (TPR) repeat protein
MAATNDKQELAHQLGAAWALLRQNKTQDALASFDVILAAHPTLIDGLYGIGLAQAIAKQYDKAAASFEKCRQMSARELELHPGNDRYEMLDRMCGQRVTDVKLAAAGQ